MLRLQDARTRRASRMALVLAASVLAACATTKLQEQWRDADYRASGTPNVVVIAVTGRDDRRRQIEEQFVSSLAKAGVAAKPSYRGLSINGPTDLDKVRRFVEGSGATHVVSVRLIDTTQQTRVSGGYYGATGFYGYYPHAWSGAYHPPTGPYYAPDVSTYRTFTTETRLFDMKSDKMVWAATMKTEEPTDFSATAQEYADLVVKQMQSHKVFGAG